MQPRFGLHVEPLALVYSVGVFGAGTGKGGGGGSKTIEVAAKNHVVEAGRFDQVLDSARFVLFQAWTGCQNPTLSKW